MTQIWKDTWRLITVQFIQFALPVLMILVYLNRLMTYSYFELSVTQSDDQVAKFNGFDSIPFDFT